MNRLHYDALALGRAEFILGLDSLKEREAEADFSFLSANIADAKTGELVFQPYTIIERMGKRIAIIGLTEADATQMPRVTGLVTALPPVQTAAKYVAELRNRVDLLVILSHLGLDEDHALAQAVPGIDVIVGGSTRKLMQEAEREGNTLIVQQGYNGEWLGRMQASFDAQGVPSNYSEQSIVLVPDFEDDPGLAELAGQYKARYPEPTPTPHAQ